MIGRSIPNHVKPSALSNERCGARSGPFVIKSLRLARFEFLSYLNVKAVQRRRIPDQLSVIAGFSSVCFSRRPASIGAEFGRPPRQHQLAVYG